VRIFKRKKATHIFYGAFPLRGEPFRIWFFTNSLWKFMIYDAGRVQIRPNAHIRDPFACGPGSVHVLGSPGIGG